MIRRPPRSTQSRSSAASDVYKRQACTRALGKAGTPRWWPRRDVLGDRPPEVPTVSRLHQLTRPLLLAAGACFLLALPFELESTVLSDRPFAEVAQSPAHAAAAWLARAGFVLPGLAVPGPAARPGSPGPARARAGFSPRGVAGAVLAARPGSPGTAGPGMTRLAIASQAAAAWAGDWAT